MAPTPLPRPQPGGARSSKDRVESGAPAKAARARGAVQRRVEGSRFCEPVLADADRALYKHNPRLCHLAAGFNSRMGDKTNREQAISRVIETQRQT